MSVSPEKPVDGMAAEEKADEFSLDEVAEDVDGSSSGVECRSLDPGEVFIDVGS